LQVLTTKLNKNVIYNYLSHIFILIIEYRNNR